MMCSFGASGPSPPGSSVGRWTQTSTPWICALTNSLQPSVGVSVIRIPPVVHVLADRCRGSALSCLRSRVREIRLHRPRSLGIRSLFDESPTSSGKAHVRHAPSPVASSGNQMGSLVTLLRRAGGCEDDHDRRKWRVHLCAAETQTSAQKSDLIGLQRVVVPPCRIRARREKENRTLSFSRLRQPTCHAITVGRIAEHALPAPWSRKPIVLHNSLAVIYRTRVEREVKLCIQRGVQRLRGRPPPRLSRERHTRFHVIPSSAARAASSALPQ